MRASTAVAFVVSLLFLLPACGALFRCGCKTLWGGADVMCNIHHGPAPACPWCSNQALGVMGAAIAVLPVVVPVLVARKRPLPRWTPFALIVPGYLLAGLMTFLLTSYPHFLVLGLRDLLGLPPGPLG